MCPRADLQIVYIQNISFFLMPCFLKEFCLMFSLFYVVKSVVSLAFHLVTLLVCPIDNVKS